MSKKGNDAWGRPYSDRTRTSRRSGCRLGAVVIFLMLASSLTLLVGTAWEVAT